MITASFIALYCKVYLLWVDLCKMLLERFNRLICDVSFLFVSREVKTGHPPTQFDLGIN
jgi:hypothetical protein